MTDECPSGAHLLQAGGEFNLVGVDHEKSSLGVACCCAGEELMARSALEPIFQAQADGEHVYVIGLNRVYHRVASVQVVA